MSAPRQILPGVTYLVTRRCAQRQFLLRPSRTTNEVFLYVLAVASSRYGVALHGFCVLSNHYHLVVTDLEARLPAFHQLLDALVARALNAALGRSESFWAPNSYSAVVLATPEDIVDKLAYVWANPAAAGLVRSGREWPGLWSAPEAIGGEPLTIERPEHFFDPKGSLPGSAMLVLTIPPGFASAESFHEQARQALAARESRALDEHPDGFAGAQRVLAQSPASTPATAEPFGALKPRVASRDKWKRIEVLRRLKGFLCSYRAAWQERRAGNFGAIFPAGTYWMRIVHGAPCAEFA
jgi:putative transposase